MHYFLNYSAFCFASLIVFLIVDKATDSGAEDGQIMFLSLFWPLTLPFAAYFLLKYIIHRIISLIERKIK
jgi:hypothetical protein